MKKILDGTSRRVGAIFNEVDLNFVEVCNSILRIAFPDHTIKGYAETEPETPTLFDCYLVKEDATIWELVCEKNDVISWDGAAWELLPYKITEINEALQFLFFDAEKIAIEPIEGITGADVQAALEEIAAALVLHGLLIPADSSGSGSGSGGV
jgi:hypothetical protein